MTADLFIKAVKGKININEKTEEKNVRNIKLNPGTWPELNIFLKSNLFRKVENLDAGIVVTGVTIGETIATVSLIGSFSSSTLETGLFIINNENRITELITKTRNIPIIKERKYDPVIRKAIKKLEKIESKKNPKKHIVTSEYKDLSRAESEEKISPSKPNISIVNRFKV
ncbi:MAG: hypothetical protein EBZ94_07255 [Crocinitomicaceae bacterium]|nr:hypothetical protein [Flavobacteriia bacterium]NDC29116.1 hypothetical protein [Crocinitomicaceae bacterium]